MSFLQLHYTSCEHGLSGYSGFQFCSVTPGTQPEIMRDIEQLTIYETPRPMTADEARRQAKELPVNLVYTYTDNPKKAIIAQVKSTGTDFSNRTGNYFAHSLVTFDPDEDLRDVLPIELWDAPFWITRQSTLTDLPALSSLPSCGTISRKMMSDFMAEESARLDQMASLLTAVDEAIAENFQVLLIAPDSTAVSRWIAGISYLMGPALARRMTFSTYSYDPRRCGAHVVGTVAAVPRFSVDVAGSFRVFDFAENNIPATTSGFSASLLARIGILDSSSLWQLATSLGARAGDSLANSFPVLAASALMLGYRLTPTEFDAAIEWLSDNTDEGVTARLATAVNSALSQPVKELPVHRKAQLAELAVRADKLKGDRKFHMTARVECDIVADAFRDIEAGHDITATFRPRTPVARQNVSEGCNQRMLSASPSQAVEMLAWAADVHADLDEDIVYRAGRDVIGPSLPVVPSLPQLHLAARTWPALTRGMADSLSTLPARSRQRILASPASDLFDEEHFEGKPDLHREWLIVSAHNGRVRPADALLRISEIDRSWQADPPDTEEIISDLWRGRPWDAEEALTIIDNLPASEMCVTAVLSRFESVLHKFPKEHQEVWEEFVLKLAGLPKGALPEAQANTVIELTTAFRLIVKATTSLPIPIGKLIEFLTITDALAGSFRSIWTLNCRPC